jgi:murein DD-endopeptidase / murein LD-carboxypeptidase
MRIDYSARARALVGTRFRAQGRSDAGLDCVGVVLATFGIGENAVKRDYRLRGDHLPDLRMQLDLHFRRVSRTQMRSGDVLLLGAGEDQPHLAICTDRGFVHAHAGIKRVVETPGPPEWPLLGVYRRRRGR